MRFVNFMVFLAYIEHNYYNKHEMLKGFKQFILRGNVVDLAVGIMIGASFNGIVDAFVKGILTPLIGVIGGEPDFSRFIIRVGKTEFLVGDFLNAIISFLIIASVIYFLIIIPMNKLTKATQKDKPKTSTTKECPFCFSVISLKAVRCPNCTSQLTKK